MVKKIKKRSRREKAKIKKFRFNLQFFQASLSETEIIYEECLEEYNEKFIRTVVVEAEQRGDGEEMEDSTTTISTEVNADIPEGAAPGEKGIKDEDIEDGELNDRDIKALFKKIAVKTHPDKLRGMDEAQVEHLTNLYKTAVEASRSGDGGALLELAYELNIDIDIDIEKEILWINEKIGASQQKIQSICKTDAWVWFHSKGEARDKIEKFIKEKMGG